MIAVNGGRPGDMLCPSSEFYGSEKLIDILGGETSNGASAPLGRQAEGKLYSDLDGLTAATDIATVVSSYVQNGYNTNYASSWFMTRGQLITVNDTTTTPVSTKVAGAGCKSLVKADKTTPTCTGPLTQVQISKSEVPSSNIPLLGDAAPGDAKEAVLSSTLLGTVASLDRNGRLAAGARLCETANDGPAKLDSAGAIVKLLDKGFDDGLAPETYSATNGWFQDTRDWYATHRNTANILMADGSVKTVEDKNGDGYFNPGFVPTALDTDTDGYGPGATTEINSFDVFCGIWLTPPTKVKGSFEE